MSERTVARTGWRTRLTSRLAIAFFLPAAAVTVVGAGVGLLEMRAALRESSFERLRAALAVREAQFGRWVNEQTNDLRFLGSLPSVHRGLAAVQRGNNPHDVAVLNAVLEQAVSTQHDFSRIVFLSAVGGRVIAASDPALLGTYRVTEQHFLEGRSRTVVQNVYPSPTSGLPTLTVAMPVRDSTGRTIAVLAGDANLTRVEDVIAERSGLGDTGEAYLVDRYHEFVRGKGYNRERYPRGVHTEIIDRAVSGESGSGVYTSYTGREVVGVWRWMPERQLALFAEMSAHEAFAPARRVALIVAALALIAVLTLALGLKYVARHVAAPVLQIADAAQAVATGDLGAAAIVRTDDEIGHLAMAFNTMTRRLRRAHGELEAQLHATERAAHDTEASRRLLRAVIDHLPALVAVKGLDGRYIMNNTAFSDFHDIPQQALLGRLPAEVLAHANVDAITAADAEVLATGHTVTVEEAQRGAGQERTFLTARFPLLDAEGAMFALGMVATDITERKRMESQILHQQKLEAVGRLAGGVAHDMNNLLTAVRCNAELLLDNMAADDPDRMPLEEIDRSVRSGSALARQLLTFSRAHVVRPSALDVNRILGGMTAMLRRYVGTGIEMRFELAPDLWLVRADEGQMEQVLLNLLSNAHDAMPAGGMATVSTSNVMVGDAGGSSVAGLMPGEYVRLAVHDTGMGIDPEMIPLLFEPFFTTKDPGRGTGLGLSTAYAIVQQAGGAITVDSMVRHGTTFSVYLPRHAEEPLPQVETLRPRAEPASGETLLIVDDEPTVRIALRRTLSVRGYQILEAQSGQDAVELFRQHAGTIALVLTDVLMAAMSGHELAERLRQQQPDIPVVFMSGYTADEVARRGLMRDETLFLQKPFNRQELLDLVGGLLRKTPAG